MQRKPVTSSPYLIWLMSVIHVVHTIRQNYPHTNSWQHGNHYRVHYSAGITNRFWDTQSYCMFAKCHEQRNGTVTEIDELRRVIDRKA